MNHDLKYSIRQKYQAFIRARVWHMDIAPSAWISETALIDRTWPRGVHIGGGAVIGEEAVVLTHDLTRGIYCDTAIGDRTIVGARAIILPGITVGCDCVIAPGAVVNRDVADANYVSGNPMTVRPIDAGDTSAARCAETSP